MKGLSRRVLAALTILAGTVVLMAIWLVMDTVPSLPSAPDAPVLAMPSVERPSSRPYSGPHPRLMERPEETHPFPLLPGDTGPIKPLFAGDPKYPFFCGQDRSRLRSEQPHIDNHDGIGVPVFDVVDGVRDLQSVVGYSKDCTYPTRVSYYYKRQGTDNFYPLSEASNDIASIVLDGEEHDFVVRLETGTINRFFYAIAVLSNSSEPLDVPSGELWNQRLVYQLRGGVGIGRQQGNFSTRYVLEERTDALARGYAVAFSTANAARNHFDIGLAEDTAWRVKRQFTVLYGEPLYTVGIGASGGAIQQYLFAQNAPGLLDAAIAIYAYPDMITQTIHVQDCELLEYFMSETDRGNPLWNSWDNRSLLQGMNADSSASNRFAPAQRAADFLTGRWNRLQALNGSSSCISGWRGLTPLVSNPNFVDSEPYYARDVIDAVDWTYWGDLAHILGVDEHGYANSTWDNTGVQYGLQSMREGSIDVETFLKLNASIGSWKSAHEMQEERFWFLNQGLLPVSLSLNSKQNMRHAAPDQWPAPRARARPDVIAAAYQSGQVFTGIADIPIIDVRHYLDDELDMHHALASFKARARIQRTMGDADNHVIWKSRQPHDPQSEALALVEQWMQARMEQPRASVADTRPAGAVDRCYDSEGNVLAEGPRVWDGDWNGRSTGECMAQYPIHSTSRMIAGEGVMGDVFQCHLQSVTAAVESGLYEPVDMAPFSERLEAIFPEGVCDYARGDAGLPGGLISALQEGVDLNKSVDVTSH